MSSRTDEREFFARRYEGVEPADLWNAVKRVLGTMGLADANDAHKTAQFSTGISLTSWGENMLATVAGNATEGSTLTIRGRPKGSFFTTKLGEDVHARGVEEQIVSAIEAELHNTAKP